VAGRTRWIGRGAAFAFRSVDDPLPLLAQLLALFDRGRQAPLAFFPKSAWAWIREGGSLSAARSAWQATARRPWAEQADAWNRLALRGLADPLGDGLDDFEATSRGVLQPLIDHLEDGA
jgi:exodeoxyribonuclease V gamma subunit